MAERFGVQIPTIKICSVLLLLLQWRYSSVLDVFSLSPPGTLNSFGLLHPVGVFTSPRRPNWLWDPTSRQFNAYQVSLQGVKRQECDDDYLSQSRLRMSGVIPPDPPHAFTAWTGTSLPLFTILAFALKVWIIIRKKC